METKLRCTNILCDLKSYEDTSPSYVLFREEGAGDVTKFPKKYCGTLARFSYFPVFLKN